MTPAVSSLWYFLNCQHLCALRPALTLLSVPCSGLDDGLASRPDHTTLTLTLQGQFHYQVLSLDQESDQELDCLPVIQTRAVLFHS